MDRQLDAARECGEEWQYKRCGIHSAFMEMLKTSEPAAVDENGEILSVPYYNGARRVMRDFLLRRGWWCEWGNNHENAIDD